MNAHASVKSSRKLAFSLCEVAGYGVVNYLDMGDISSPCVVCLHGFGADLLTWQLCLVPLATRYRVIALDLPGHGRSATDVGTGTLDFMTGWLEAVFTALSISSAHIVGHSMGAKIALGFASCYGTRVRSLSLIAPAGLGGEFHHMALDAYLSVHSPESALTLARQLLGPKGRNLEASLIRSLLEAVREPARAKAMSSLLSNAQTFGLSLAPRGYDWSSVRCPVQILWGDHDRLIPLPPPSRMPDSARLHVIKGAGHLPHMETSASVVAHLKEFLG